MIQWRTGDSTASVHVETNAGEAGAPLCIVEGITRPIRIERPGVGRNKVAKGGILSKEHCLQDRLPGSVGDVGPLPGEGHGRGTEFGENRGAIRSDQGKVFTGGIQLEVGVQFRMGRGPVLSGGKDEKMAAARHGGTRGKDPPGQIGGVIGESITSQIEGGRIGIVDLDPVRKVSVLVGNDPVVARHELGDTGSGRKEGSPRCEQKEE